MINSLRLNCTAPEVGIILAALQGQHEGTFLRFSRRSLDAAKFLQVRHAKHLKQASLGTVGRTASIHRPAGGDRPELLDAVAADADVPVVEVDGRVAMAGDEADLVADAEAVGGVGYAETAVLVGGALVGGGGLVADERGPESKASAFRPASTIARSSVGRLITVAQTKRLGSKAWVGAPSRSRLRP
jgi:hypothetical protein